MNENKAKLYILYHMFFLKKNYNIDYNKNIEVYEEIYRNKCFNKIYKNFKNELRKILFPLKNDNFSIKVINELFEEILKIL